jgi:hypothetical protein
VAPEPCGVAEANALAPDDAADDGADDVGVESGPVMKKVPANGAPRPSVLLNAVTLKFVRGVVALSIDDTFEAKSSG